MSLESYASSLNCFIQTSLGILGALFLVSLAHITGLIIWITLLFTRLWPLAVVYAMIALIWDRNISSCGGRRINLVRNLSIWRYYCNYFPMKLIKTADLDSKKNYIFGYHPHGIFTAGVFGNFVTNGTGFNKIFPELTPYVLTLKDLFRFPFFRDIYLGFGMCDISKESIRHICTKGDGGNVAVMVVGGASESLDARPGSCKITLKRRKGFIRMALLTGASLVPVFAFGENDIYEQPYNNRGSYIRILQEHMCKLFKFTPKIWYGKGIILPFRRRFSTIVGQPIHVTKKLKVSEIDVNELHQLYIQQLKELYGKYKTDYSNYPNAELEII